MTTTVERGELANALAHAAQVAERNSLTTAGALLVASDGTLRLDAVGPELSFSTRIPAELEGPAWSLEVHAKDLLKRVRAIPGKRVCLSVTCTKELVITAFDTPRRFALRGASGEDFKAVAFPGGAHVTVKAGALLALIAKTQPSISTDVTRPALNAALIEWSPGEMRMVATDGHRLMLASSPADQIEGRGAVLIPLPAVSVLKRLCSELGVDDEIAITPTEQVVYFTVGVTVGVTVVASGLVDATFPAYDQVIPKSYERRVRVPRAPLADVVKAADVSSSRGETFTLVPGALQVTNENDTGDVFDAVPVEYDGPEFSLKMAARYVAQALESLGGDDVLLDLAGSCLDPVVFRPTAGADFAVVMPVRP